MKSPSKRLKILTANEIEDLYGLPSFTNEERFKYFTLNSLEEDALKNLRSISSKIVFILSLAYFKAKTMFFTFSEDQVQDDVNFVCLKYFSHHKSPDITISKPTRLNHQYLILSLLNYQPCTQEIRHILKEKAENLSTIHAKPIFIFKELIAFLECQKIVIPGYSFMQDVVGNALNFERTRLESIIMTSLLGEVKNAFDKLLETEEGFYELTFLKKEPKNFSYKVITAEVNKRQTIEPLYRFSTILIPKLGISNENIRYYAFLVSYYSTSRLKRIKRETVYLYLICFVFHRYQKINDDLIDTFIYYVRYYINKAKQYAKEQVYKNKSEGNQHLQDVAKILDLFTDKNIPIDFEFTKVKKIAFDIMPEDKFPLLVQYLLKESFDETEYEWNHYLELSQAFKKNLRRIFLSLLFKSSAQKNPLLEAITFLNTTFEKNRSLSQIKTEAFPQEVISSNLTKYLYTQENQVIPDKYEFLIYRLLRKQLEAGDIFVDESLGFRSFEEELISKDKWKQKDEIINKLGLPYLHEPIDQILCSFEECLEPKLKAINDRVQEGKNSHVKTFKSKGETKWKLPYHGQEDETNHIFYDQLRQVGIGDVMNFVNDKCAFVEAFTHILGKDVRSQVSPNGFFAGIMAHGLNLGIGLMSENSNMSYAELTNISNNFLRPETLKEANDHIIDKMAELPIFKHYNIKEDTVHSSSDGQKFETQFDTINSRHSPKYFGLKKGVVSYTLVANHVPINAKIIGANEHESHFVFDILYNNTSEVEPEIHSTDTHGTNEVNFAILHFFGYQFAPRYKNLANRPNMIYSFQHPSQFEDFIIKPVRKINTQLIKDEWDNIQRIIASLAMKTTNQSTIIRKLSSYERKNRTKRALWEYDNIIKTLYILDYIDSLELRQNVQKALNRGEAYHKLRKAIAYAHSGKFRVKTELEQQVWNECSRIIANCILFYNAYILSRLFEKKKELHCYEQSNFITNISPLAWQHINLYGKYEFYGERHNIDMEEMIHELEKMPLNS